MPVSRSTRNSLAICVAAIALLLIVPMAASAVPLPMPLLNCSAGLPNAPTGAEEWVPQPSPNFKLTDTCPTKIAIAYQGTPFYSEEAAWSFTGLRAGLEITAVKLRLTGGSDTSGVVYSWQPCSGCGSIFPLSGLPAPDADGRVSLPLEAPATELRIVARCMRTPTCGHTAGLSAKDFSFELDDAGGPGVEAHTSAGSFQDLQDKTIWNGGTGFPMSFAASDNGVGVSHAEVDVEVDGTVATPWLTDTSCREQTLATFVTTHICPETVNQDLLVDLSAVPEGVHEVYASATDAMQQGGESLRAHVGIDRTPPVPPSGIVVAGQINEFGWTHEPDLQIKWDTAPEQPTGTSPIANSEYELRRKNGSLARREVLDANAVESPKLSIPSEGKWEGGARFIDLAGNRGEPGYESVGYDTDAPTAPELVSPGWVSRNALIAGYSAEWTQGAQPDDLDSGLAGYGFSTNEVPVAAAPMVISADKDARARQLPVLAAGKHYLHLRGISRASVGSTTDSEPISVDAQAPKFSPPALPSAGWLLTPPSFGLQATDEDGAGGPGSGVAQISYRFDDGVTTTVSGSSATVTPHDSDHAITFTARDAAGNVSDPQTIAFSIDSAAPVVDAARDPEAGPAGLAFDITDAGSGNERAWLEIRAAGGNWQPLGASLERPDDGVHQWQGKLTVADAALSSGEYDLRVLAEDVAGNIGASDLITLRFPLRAAVSVTATIADVTTRCRTASGAACKSLRECPKGATCRMVSIPVERSAARSLVRPYNSNTALIGEVLGADGSPLTDAALEVSVAEPYSAAPARFTLRTDSRGRFVQLLGRGASRNFTVSFAGDSSHLPQSSTAKLKVRAGITARVSPNATRRGNSTVVSGRVLGGSERIPAGGKRLNLQYWTGESWDITGRTIRTDDRGNFAFPSHTWPRKGGRVTIAFRVIADFDDLWPFAPGFSNVVKLRLRP